MNLRQGKQVGLMHLPGMTQQVLPRGELGHGLPFRVSAPITDEFASSSYRTYNEFKGLMSSVRCIIFLVVIIKL